MPLGSKLMNFIVNHWVLVTLFVVLLLILFFEEARAKDLKHISIQDTVDLMNNSKPLILDIRDEQAFRNGHIIQARHIPGHNIDQRINEIVAFKQRPVVIVDQHAPGQATSVLKKLRQQGFEELYVLTGGMKAWIQAMMPTQKEE